MNNKFSMLENKTILSVEKDCINVLIFTMTDGSVYHLYSDEACLPGITTFGIEEVIEGDDAEF